MHSLRSNGPSRPRTKICGLTSPHDAEIAEAVGADYLGAVLTRGFGRSVPEAAVGSLFDGRAALRVAVLVDEEPVRAAELAESLGADVIQLHGEEPVEAIHRIRELGSWDVWKAIRVRDPSDVSNAVDLYGQAVDGLVVEGSKEGVVGGGGATLGADPVKVRGEIPEPLTFVLAGGLSPDNVHTAVARYRPDVVDVSSGVELSLGRKEASLMKAFVRGATGLEPFDGSEEGR